MTGVAHAETDLLTVYQQALENDTQYKISEANLRATEQGVRISRSSLLPQISGSASKQRRDFDNEGQGLDGSPSDPFNNRVDTTTLGVGLTQTLFDWSQWVALDQAELRVRASELNHAASLQSLMTRSAQAYFDVLAAEENLETTQAELKALKQQLDLTREQYESGLANSTDYLDAQANYDQSVANEVALQNSLNIAQENLRELTGQYYMALEGIGDNFTLSQPTPNNIDDWMRVAREENLGLKAQQMNVRVARKEVKRNRSGHYPTADLSINYSDSDSDTTRTFAQGISNQQFNPSLPEDPNTNPRLSAPPGTVANSSALSDGFSAQATLRVPIFSGFRTSAQTEQAKQNYLRSTHELEQRDRLVQKSARNAFTNLQSSIKSFEANKRAVESSQSSLEATQDGYQAGTRNIVDVLRSTRSLYSAKRSLTRAKYDYLLNSLRLKEAAGTLTEQDVQTINNWLNQY
ncbi:MAG: TolC family outer membrane protein [Kangiellaceae bacterium]|nr:TolC family outer membrane protein [Kangiellaceae bacterium]